MCGCDVVLLRQLREHLLVGGVEALVVRRGGSEEAPGDHPADPEREDGENTEDHGSEAATASRDGSVHM